MRNLFLKSLPKSFSEEDIGRLAAALGATVTSAMVWKDKRGKSRGVALAEFETEEQADAVKAGLKQRMLRRPGEGEAAAGAGGVCFEIGEGGSAWVLCQADEGDRNALIVEAAFREASHQKDRDSAPRQPRVKEDPREKQKRCELLRKERKAAKLAELEADVPPEERDNLLRRAAAAGHVAALIELHGTSRERLQALGLTRPLDTGDVFSPAWLAATWQVLANPSAANDRLNKTQWRHYCDRPGCVRWRFRKKEVRRREAEGLSPAPYIRLWKCGRCRCACYCSKACQTLAWPKPHRDECDRHLGLGNHPVNTTLPA